MIDLDKYSKFICKELLSLKKGDAVSVNTEEKDFEFARKIANCAVEITSVNVKIVVTESGKPSDVIEFDAQDQTVKPTLMAMIRIAHFEKSKPYDENSLSVVIDKEDMKAIQKLGHLAEPVVLNRRIAVPWCVVPFYDFSDERWAEVEKNIDNFQSITTAISYRKKFLEHSDVHKMHVTGKDTDFEFELSEDVFFVSNENTVQQNRRFYSDLFVENLRFTLDKNSLNGVLKAKSTILGKPHNLTLTFKNGVCKPAEWTNELRQILSFDEDVSKPGFVNFKDKGFELYLGGSILESLPMESSFSEEIPESFNQSLYSIKLTLDNDLNVSFTDCDGKEHEIIRKGFFLE